MPVTPADLCHATIARAPFTREGWIFELKHDGFRAFARAGGEPELRSRWGRSLAASFPEVYDVLSTLPAAVLDGELVVPDRDGRSDFDTLRRRSLMRRPREVARMADLTPAVLVVFYVLDVGGGAWVREYGFLHHGPIQLSRQFALGLVAEHCVLRDTKSNLLSYGEE